MTGHSWINERDRQLATASVRWEEAQKRSDEAREASDRAWKKAHASTRAQTAAHEAEQEAFLNMMELLRPGYRAEQEQLRAQMAAAA